MRGVCRYIHNYEDYLANEEAQVPPWEDEWRSELWGDEAHLEAPHRKEVAAAHFRPKINRACWATQKHALLACTALWRCNIIGDRRQPLACPSAHVLGRVWPVDPGPWVSAWSKGCAGGLAAPGCAHHGHPCHRRPER